MAIKVSYHGPYGVKRRHLPAGGYDLKRIRKEMEAKVSPSTQRSSGVYIFLRQTRGLEAKYVGVNSNGNILKEAMGKSDVISNHLLPNHGKTKLLLLACKKPKAMGQVKIKQRLVELEDYLIVDLTLKDHPLVNKRNKPRNSKFDFVLSSKSIAAETFKGLVNRKGIPHI